MSEKNLVIFTIDKGNNWGADTEEEMNKFLDILKERGCGHVLEDFQRLDGLFAKDDAEAILELLKKPSGGEFLAR